MSEEKKEDDKVAQHRQATLLSGNLSDFQLTNMKAWPYVLFDDFGLSKVELKWDFTNEDFKNDENVPDNGVAAAGKVTYDLFFNDTSKFLKLGEEERQFRLDQLMMWTKFMFWKDTEVETLKEGKKWT